MLFVFVEMPPHLPLVTGSGKVRIAMVGSAWFGHLSGGARFELVPGDLVVLDGFAVNSWQRVVVVGGPAWVPVVCLGEEAVVDGNDNGHLRLAACPGDGSGVSPEADAELRVLSLSRTFLESVYGEDSRLLRDVGKVVLLGGVRCGVQQGFVVQGEGWLHLDFIEMEYGNGDSHSQFDRSSSGARLCKLRSEFDGAPHAVDGYTYCPPVAAGCPVVAWGPSCRDWQWVLVVKCSMFCFSWMLDDGGPGMAMHQGRLSCGGSDAGDVHGGGSVAQSTVEEGRFSADGFAATRVCEWPNESDLWLAGLCDLEESGDGEAFLRSVKLAVDCRASQQASRPWRLSKDADWRQFHVRNWRYVGVEEPVGEASAADIVDWVERELLAPVKRVLDSGGRVLLYCDVGVHRSVTAACIVMWKSDRCDWRLAWRRLLARRRWAKGIDDHVQLMNFLMDPQVLPESMDAKYPYGETLQGWLANSWNSVGVTFVKSWIEDLSCWVSCMLHRSEMQTPMLDVQKGSKVVFVLQRGKLGFRPLATQCRAFT